MKRKGARFKNMQPFQTQIEDSWKTALADDFNAPYFLKLMEFLIEERKRHSIYPPSSKTFSAFNFTPINEVKVVIIGQDPYHGEGQAHGLCFSVQEGVKPPPSLRNIFKEIKRDLKIEMTGSGNLEKWARQGVLLINATLTVRAGEAGSHQKKGWEQFTDSVIRKLSEQQSAIIFLLWGAYAQRKAELIDTSKHHILMSTHPSPLSAHRGFLGCSHFSKTNAILRSEGLQEIDWS